MSQSNAMKYKKVLVVYGGWNREREVNLMSTPAIIEGLREQGYTVESLDLSENFAEVSRAILHFAPDVIFNNIYGRTGEDGCLQGFCEIARIPYTQSGVRASAIGMHKPTTQYILHANGLPVPNYFVFQPHETKKIPFDYPVVVKPTEEGSSVGVHMIRSDEDLQKCLQDSEESELMAEAFIPGRELSVAVFADGRAGIMEIIPTGMFYDYEAKYISEDTQYICPADIPQDVERRAIDISRKAFALLDCSGVARVDLRYNPAEGVNGLYILEINTVPGLTSHSIVPKIAEHLGTRFPELLSWMVENARCPL